MNIEGKRLPLIHHEDAIFLDVWRLDDGVGITLSTSSGKTYAGCQISKEDWDTLVRFIAVQFGEQQRRGP